MRDAIDATYEARFHSISFPSEWGDAVNYRENHGKSFWFPFN